MSLLQRNLLAIIFTTILYFVSPSGADMTGIQWLFYISGVVSSFIFIWTE